MATLCTKYLDTCNLEGKHQFGAPERGVRSRRDVKFAFVIKASRQFGKQC